MPIRRVLFAGLLALVAAWAQSFEAQITGQVTDASGGVVPGVRVTATNIATGLVHNAQSNDQGLYRVPALPPGQYRISATATGFKRFEQGPVTLNVNDVRALDIGMQVGDTSEQVVVSASAAALQTETATVGTVVSQRSIESLPLNVRDPLALIALTPGVTFGTNFGNGGGTDVGRNFFKSDFNVGGGRSGTQELLLDGAPNTTPDVNRGIINPPVDSVQEFKVQSNSYDAEFGRTDGGIINVITKSGTNDIHGTAYDFYRSSVLDANNFFNNRAGVANPSFKRHQMGGNAGGPIIKNKTFIFGDYEGLRQGYPITSTSTVPTALQRTGDFSKTFTNVNGTPTLIQVYDPASLALLPDGTRMRSVFPGNVIPSSRFDTVAKNVLPYLPLPNTTGDPISGQNNYIYNENAITNSDKWDVRGDENFTENTRAFARVSWQKDVRVVPGNLPLPAGGGRNTTDTYSQAVVDVTHVFSAQLIGTFQASASRAQASQFGRSAGFDVSKLGFPSALTALAAPQFPVLNIGDVVGTSNGSDSFTQFQPRNVFAWHGGAAYSRGSHNIKAGGEFRVLDFNEGQNTAPSGVYTFDRLFTQGPNPNTASRVAGFGFADFLLGNPTSGNFRQINTISTRGLYWALYVHDDWRVNSKLTLNIGLRYDVGIGNREKYNRLAYFDPNSTSPLGTPAGLPNLKGILRWVGQNGNPADNLDTNYTNFGPRFGFAYHPLSKVVIRGGYGIFFVPRVVQGNGDGAVEAFRDTPFVGSIDGVTPANTLSNPYPQGVLPPLNDGSPVANVGASIQAPLHDFKSGYAQMWSLGTQWEMPFGIVMQVNYWANKGTHLITGAWNINQLPDQYLALGSALNDQVPNPFFGLIQSGALSGRTISRRQSLLPFPQYAGDSGVQQVFVPAGNSNYQAGSIQAEKRLTSSLSFQTSYTWSKAIDDVTGLIDYYNRRLNKSLSAFDTPNNFVASFVYQLPFGHNRQFGAHWNRVENAILGGWDFDGIVRLQSGTPVGLSTPVQNNGKSAKVDNPTLNRWFDTTAFSVAAPFTFGSVGPRLPDVRTDWVRNVDAVIVKTFTTSLKDHEIRTQFRTEIFNVMNTPNFAAPNGTASSQSFGQVTRQFNNPREIQFALKVNF